MDKVTEDFKLKQCNKCKKFLPEAEFYFRKETNKFRNECKKCWIRRQQEYYRENSKKIIKRQQKTRKNPKKIRDRNRKDKDKRKKYAKENPEIIKAIQKRFRKNHPHNDSKYYPRYKEKIREKTRKRRLKKQQLFEDFTLEEWKQKLAETKGICPICNRPFIEVYPFCATIDHTPSISKAPEGFHYTIDNITPMCGSCNSAKGKN